MTDGPVRNILSLDVEDYMFADPWRSGPAPFDVSAQVEPETRRVLDLFAELGVTATCFIVGRVAQALPGLVKEIAARGHEVAAHGYDHVRMQYLTPTAFRGDLRTSRAILEDLTGRPVRGFRAPGFSLTVEHGWAFDVMAELGVTYDSSVRLVWPAGLGAGEVISARAAAAGVREVPGFKLGIGRLAVPLAGGGGLRVVPAAVTHWVIRRINARGVPVPIYLHPYDMAIDRPAGPWRRGSAWGRVMMRFAHTLQLAGRRRVGAHLSDVVTLAGVTTMEQFIRETAPAPAMTPGTVVSK